MDQSLVTILPLYFNHLFFFSIIPYGLIQPINVKTIYLIIIINHEIKLSFTLFIN